MYAENVHENSTTNWTGSEAGSSQQSSHSFLVVQVFLGGISVLSILGNGLVCVVIMRNRDMLRSAYNMFLFSLATTDMLTGK